MANRQVGVNTESMPFVLKMMSKFCGWPELLRELVQNGIDAGAKTIEVGAIDPDSLPGTDVQARKLYVLDDGDGLDLRNAASHLGDLFSSGRLQSMHTNFGIGAKIVLFRLSPHGTDYWTRPAGTKDYYHARLALVDDVFCLQDLDGHGTLVERVTDPRRVPTPLRGAESGTMVVIHGHGANDDTAANPGGLVGGRSWVSRVLNRRYFQVPEGVALKAAVEDVYGKARPIAVKTGTEVLASANPSPHTGCEVIEFDSHGRKEKAKVTWYLLHPGAEVKNSHGREEHPPIFSQTFNGECYDARWGQQARKALNHFGIAYAARRVAIYVEVAGYTPTEDRRHLKGLNGQLDLVSLGRAFRQQMPQKLIDAENEHRRRHIQSGGNGKWRSKLKGLLDEIALLRVDKTSSTTMTADRDGTVDRPNKNGDDKTHSTSAKNPAPTPTANRHGTPGGSQRGHTTRPREVSLPTVRWMKADDMDDDVLVAQWMPTTSEIWVNTAHDEVKTAVAYWQSKVLDSVDARELLDGAVRDLWESQMIEKVINACRLDMDDEIVTVLLSSVVTDRLVTDLALRDSVDRKFHGVAWK